MRQMNTNEDVEIGNFSDEVAKLNGEISVGESVVANARDNYAKEFGTPDAVSNMRLHSMVSPVKYKLPRQVRRRNGSHLEKMWNKIKVLFGLDNEVR